ncbi:hypothetical protein ARMGADRAFT_779844 [Armillaria gallica]|uniref:Uncharacterized protein n=1 Tax=Armillaria gallica TaxID=47427 RepID=A0A2H3CJ80_ARMGA|nr:hypothetical protein ARMGADRAFT_779844 [Armillaria gallica]
MGLVFRTIFSLHRPPKSLTSSFSTPCIFYLQSLSMNMFGNWSISIARCVFILRSAYIWQASPLPAYFISSATRASVALTTGGPSDVRGHFVFQGVGVFLEGISKKAADPSIYPFPFDCWF